MELNTVLNQYELDAIGAPLRESFPFQKLSGKTVVVSGAADTVRAISLSLLACNEEKKLNMRVVVLPDKKPEGLERGDGAVSDSKVLSGNVDYWIETGFFACPEKATAEYFTSSLSRADRIVNKLRSILPQRVLLINNTRCYGASFGGALFSEKEQGGCPGGSEGILCQLSRCVETVFSSAAKQYGFALKTLRAADLLGAFSNSGETDSLISRLSDGGKISFAPHSLKSSYLYINDFLSAVYCLLFYGECEAYNACGDGCTVTPVRLCAEIDELFDNCGVTLSDDGMTLSQIAVDSTKLKRLGWQPKNDIKDSLLMAVRAKENSSGVFMFPDAYDGKLGTIQQVLLGFLTEIDRICRKHDIKYFLGGGSLLGAIRHHGFIPWDDDADVMMLRDDYEKFLSVIPDELPNFISIQSQQTEKGSHFPFVKLRIDNTVLSTEFSARFENLHNGVFLDVLAQDKTSNKPLAQKIHVKLTAQLRWLVLNKWRKTPVDANNRFVSFCADILKTIIPLSVLEKAQNGIMKLYRNKDTGLLYDSMGRNVERGAFSEEWLSEAIYVDFENTRLPVPKEYDKYLTYLYGDYRQMVPVSRRHVSHDIVRIDLGAFADYKCEGKMNHC